MIIELYVDLIMMMYFQTAKIIRIICIASFVAGIGLSPTSAYAEKCTIQWLYTEQPPIFFITKGYGAGMGTGQRTTLFFINQLKDCDHVLNSANVARVISTMKQYENACHASLYPTPEREKFIEFTIPVRITLSNALIILDSQRDRFKPFLNAKGHISLEDLIKNGFRIGIAKGRVYRGIIDATLKKYKNNRHIIEHPGLEDAVGKLVRMMVAGRIDALLGYPAEAHYVARTLESTTKVRSIHITGMDEYGLSYAGCSKTERGKAIVKRLNAIILKHRTTPQFMDFVEHWLDTDEVKRLRGYVAKEFGK